MRYAYGDGTKGGPEMIEEQLGEILARTGRTERTDLSGEMARLEEDARDFAFASKSENTRRAYRADWTDFTAWCAEHGRLPLPAHPQTLALFLTDRARTCKVSTLQRRLSCISVAHRLAGLESPTQSGMVRTVWAGIKRSKGVAPDRKTPILTELLRRMVRSLDEEALLGVRDRTLLVMDYAGAFRRAELVSLDVADLRLTEDGLVCRIRRSKTDQEGAGREVGLPYGSHRETCPVRCCQAWLKASGISSGPVFRPVTRDERILPARLSDRAVALVIKRTVRTIGLDPELFAGHSLRSGLATAAAAAGASERAIMQQTGHKSSEMVRRYIREGSLFRENAAAVVGL